MLLAIANPINSSELLFPNPEVFQIAGFAVLVELKPIPDGAAQL
jgi:hypothetical protein